MVWLCGMVTTVCSGYVVRSPHCGLGMWYGHHTVVWVCGTVTTVWSGYVVWSPQCGLGMWYGHQCGLGMRNGHHTLVWVRDTITTLWSGYEIRSPQFGYSRPNRRGILTVENKFSSFDYIFYLLMSRKIYNAHAQLI